MSNTLPNVRLQNLRDFTVQIRRSSDEAIVGTRIAVTMEGQVVTCAHVVEAALGVHPRQADGTEIEVYFRAQDEAERARHMSAAMGYHWGQVEMAEVLEIVRQHSENS